VKIHTALARSFAAEGVRTVFGLMGNANLEWWLDLTELGIKVHSVRHEGPAVSMAEGWARATGEPGVATVTRGPGVTQTASALTVASRSRVPLVLFAGDSPLGVETEEQYLDQRKFFDAIGVGLVGLYRAQDADDAVREAFFRARTEQRPIVLNVPSDVGGQTYEAFEDYAPSTTLPWHAQRIEPDPDRLREAVRIIAESERPVILAGLGVERSDAVQAVVRLGDRIGALLATTWPMKGRLESPWNARIAGQLSTKTAAQLFSEADCVVGVGTSLDQRTLAGGYAFSEARFIHIDVKLPYRMGNGRLADCFLQGDARQTLLALEAALAEERYVGVGFRTDDVRARLRLSDEDPDPRQFEIEAGTVDPRLAARTLDECLPTDVGIISGMAHHTGITALSMTRPRPQQWITTRFSCIGQVLPTAIGIAAALSPAPLVAIDGDTGAMMHVNELDTAARIGVKLLMVVLNDEALGNEYQRLVASNLDRQPSMVPCPDLGAVARALGCRGRLVRSTAELRAGVEEFLDGEGPMVIDVRTSRNVPSVAYRRLQFGLDD
jgi:thiamine pyrophosphate-dependent acetolactate synthase large subunit-like protein